MRIAISGTHYSGKTSLVEAISKSLPSYEVFEEPYRLMEDEGYEFSDPPSVEDYEKQLEHSLSLIAESSKKAIFDRCPLDFLAYGLVQAEREGDDFDIEALLESTEEALASIDILVFLGVEDPDRIPVPRTEDRDFRLLVDEKLREILVENSLGILGKVTVLELSGTLNERFQELAKHLK